MKAYWEKNKETLLAKQRARNRRAYEKNKQSYRARSKSWKAKNPERMRELQKAYVDRNRDRLKDYYRQWYLANKGRAQVTARRLKLAKYGLTLETFQDLVATQNGTCAICAEPMKLPAVDHCHRTGRVRGLLCRKCNSGIGMFMDDPSLLQRAINYLTSSSSGAISTTSSKPSRRRSTRSE